MVYLDHFIEAHDGRFDNALREIKSGKKRSHWMWYIFPIDSGLWKSDMAQYYGIESTE